MEGTSDSNAMFQLFKDAGHHSINLLSDAVVGDLEGMVSHLMDIHFPGSIDMVLGGRKMFALGVLPLPPR